MQDDNQFIDQLHNEAAQLMRKGRSEQEIITRLCELGAQPHYASQVIDNITRDKAKRKGFWITLMYGAGFLILGGVLNFISWQFAVKSGAYAYYVFWGVMVVGLIYIAKAFILYRK